MKIYWNKYLIILPFWVLQACTPQVYDQASCRDLIFKSFKGSPFAANKLKQHCQKVQTSYTTKSCQSALNELILVGDLDVLRKKYGPLITDCFTENDLAKFGKNDKP